MPATSTTVSFTKKDIKKSKDDAVRKHHSMQYNRGDNIENRAVDWNRHTPEMHQYYEQLARYSAWQMRKDVDQSDQESIVSQELGYSDESALFQAPWNPSPPTLDAGLASSSSVSQSGDKDEDTANVTTKVIIGGKRDVQSDRLKAKRKRARQRQQSHKRPGTAAAL